MKKILFTALLTAGAFSTNLRAQTITATYTGNHLKNQVKAVFTGNIETEEKYTQASTQPPTIFSYTYSDGKSLTIMTDDGGYSQSSDPANNITVISPTEQIYYKDQAANLFRMEWVTIEGAQSFTSSLIDYKWKITKEKATIAGYKCTKAIGKYQDFIITAWFAKDIKINDGPTQFSGLPGLILKLGMGDMYEIIASNISTSTNTITVAEPVAKGILQPFQQ